MKTVNFLGKAYIVENGPGLPTGAIALDTLTSAGLVCLRNLLVANMDLGKRIKLFQNKTKAIASVRALLDKWSTFEFDDELPDEMKKPAPKAPDILKAAAGSFGRASGSPFYRDGTKQAYIINRLRSRDGATVLELGAQLNWKPATVRCCVTRNLGKYLGFKITKSKVTGRGQVYRIAV